MDWFQLMRGYKDYGKPHYVAQSGDLDGHERWDFSKGKQIENWRSSAWIKSKSAEEDAPPDDGLVNHLALLIFSSRMRLAMESAGILGIQYLAIRFFESDGSEYPGYSIANILNLRSSLDYDRSDFSVFPEDYFWANDRGRIFGLRIAVLKRSTLQDLDILRLENFHHAVFVSCRFVDLYPNKFFWIFNFRELKSVNPETTAGQLVIQEPTPETEHQRITESDNRGTESGPEKRRSRQCEALLYFSDFATQSGADAAAAGNQLQSRAIIARWRTIYYALWCAAASGNVAGN